jgi:hypothetical protein
MSCDSNSNKVGRSAGLSAGIGALAGKISNTAGATLARLEQAGNRLGQATAPISAAVLDVVDRKGIPAQLSRDTAIRATAIGAATGLVGMAIENARQDGGAEPPKPGSYAAWEAQLFGSSPATLYAGAAMLGTWWAAKTARVLTGGVGTSVSRATRGRQVGEVIVPRWINRISGKPMGKMQVRFWESGLAGPLNRADLLGAHVRGKGVRSSEGAVFEIGEKTWHRGTSVVDTPGGERTITHLQSLSLPADHYFFNRPLSDEHAAGIAVKTVRPEDVPGYVGQVSSLEMLAPGWAMAKRAMITSQLYWGGSQPAGQVAGKQAEQPAAEAVRA